uniref:Uncharacterized protein n=1 Tax=Chloropicon laureae TaxID=464258 RepID=A0A7S3E4B4_9CHLO
MGRKLFLQLQGGVGTLAFCGPGGGGDSDAGRGGKQGSFPSSAASLCCGLPLLSQPGYVGHYVLLYGYDSEAREFAVKDPASHQHKCTIKEVALEKARKSFGTDEDVIIVPYLS